MHISCATGLFCLLGNRGQLRFKTQLPLKTFKSWACATATRWESQKNQALKEVRSSEPATGDSLRTAATQDIQELGVRNCNTLGIAEESVGDGGAVE